jgi:hypothetical protein
MLSIIVTGTDQKMQQRRRFRRVEVDLDGVVQFQQNGDEMGCIVCNISEECMGALILTQDPRVRQRGDIDLNIFIPAERTPANCTGKIIWHSEDKGFFRNYTGFLAGMIITGISRMDQRRLELVMARFPIL